MTALASLLLLTVLQTTDLAQRLNAGLYDGLQRISTPAPDPRIVVVAIDDRSLQELGPWPFPRGLHAQAIDRLHAAGARAVAYDVLFMEPTPEDDLLAAALRRSGTVHLPLVVETPGDNGAPWRENRPIEPIASSAAGLHHVALQTDQDGVIRRQPLYLRAGEQTWSHLVLPLASQGQSPRSPPGAPAVGAADLRAVSPMAVRYVGGTGAFRTVSFVDLVRGETPEGVLKDKLVLVGAVSAGLGDQYATPTSPGDLTPGVEIQASVLQTLLNGRAPLTPPLWLSLAAGAIILCGLLASFRRFHPTTTLMLSVALGASALIASVLLYLLFAIWWTPMPTLISIAFALPLWSWRRLAATSAHVQDELVALRQRPELLGQTSPAIGYGDALEREVLDLRYAVRRLDNVERFISDTLQGLPDAIAVCDQEDNILMLNRHAEALFDLSLEQRPSIADINARIRDPEASIEAGETAPVDIETLSGRTLSVVAVPLHSSAGLLLGRILRFTDVTEIRTAERQRERALQLLSHDMRAPQVSILTLLEQDPSVDPATRQRLEASARQTLNLADAYVRLARAESTPFKPIVADLHDVLQEAADALWGQASGVGVEIRLPEMEEPMLLTADVDLLRRMMINLFENALKYGAAGGDAICELGLIEGDGEVTAHITVRDHGPGVPPGQIASLFEPFSGSPSNDRSFGLGLALVRTVARRHGGDVRYEGSDAGAVFVVELPVFAEDEEDNVSAAARLNATTA